MGKKRVIEEQTAQERTTYNITPEKFVEAWETSGSIQEVCEKLRMPYAITQNRASNYRKKGINLKKFPRKRVGKELDVDELNQLIEKIRSRERGKKK